MDGFARQGRSSRRLSVECLEDRFLLAGGLLPAYPLLPLPPGTATHVSSTAPYRSEPGAAPLRPAQGLAAPGHDRTSDAPSTADARSRDQDDDGEKGAEYRDQPEHDSPPNWVLLGGGQALTGASGGLPGAAPALTAPAAVPIVPVTPGGGEPPAQELARPAATAVAQVPVAPTDSVFLAGGGVPADTCAEGQGAAVASEPAPPEVTPPAGAPLAGALPFDLGALQRGVDRFFARLADLREEWDGVWVSWRLLPWLTATAAAALVIAGRRNAPPVPAAAPLPRGEP